MKSLGFIRSQIFCSLFWLTKCAIFSYYSYLSNLYEELRIYKKSNFLFSCLQKQVIYCHMMLFSIYLFKVPYELEWISILRMCFPFGLLMNTLIFHFSKSVSITLTKKSCISWIIIKNTSIDKKYFLMFW